MPVIVAFFARQLLVIGVQIGIFSAIDKFITPLLNKAISAIVQQFGVSESEANDILANEVLTTAESLGLTVALSKARLPLAIAERLGFTSKGFKARKLKPETEAKVARSKGSPKTSAKRATEEAQEISEQVSRSRGIGLQQVSSIASILIAGLGIPVGVGLLITNTIDFAAWSSSSYQNTFQGLLSKFGINPDADAPSSKVLSDDMWKKIWGVYQNLGATEIKDPYKGATVPFTKENLTSLVDKIASQIMIEKGEVKTKQLLAAMQGFMVFGATPKLSGGGSLSLGGGQAPTGMGDVKVFSGTLSQGALGAGLLFTPRPDDLIESMAELNSAISNNVSPFLATLLGKIKYEIKVVPSVVINGLTRKGAGQTIITSYDKDMKPKTKNVVNKFAVADLFIMTDRGNRTKIARLVLGPTDAIKFRPAEADLGNLALGVSESIVVNSTDEINSIVSNTPVTVSSPPSQPAYSFETNRVGATVRYRADIQAYEALDGNGKRIDIFMSEVDAYRAAGLTMPSSSADTSPPVARPLPVGETAQPISVPNNALPAGALSANTLYEFYGAFGKQLPSIDERGRLYQSLGLGQEAFYTGTSEQNTKLLQTLKQKGI